MKRARIYYAYQQIEELFQPFTSSHPDANFQVALFLMNTLMAPGQPLEDLDGIAGNNNSGGNSSGSGGGETKKVFGMGVGSNNIPHGVSLRRILLTLAKNAKVLGAFKVSQSVSQSVSQFVCSMLYLFK